MTQQTSPYLEGKFGWEYGENGWNTGMDENILKFSFMFDKNVDGVVATLPPAVNGQAWFLTTDNRLYFAVGTTFYSSPTPKWFEFNVKSTGQLYVFNGTSALETDSLSELSSQLVTVQSTLGALGTAAFSDASDFATQSDLDVAASQANGYTDTLRSDLAASTGSTLSGFIRNSLPVNNNTVSKILSGTAISVWEKVSLITDKPTPSDSSTWDWTPAIQAALNEAGALPTGSTVVLPTGSYRITNVNSNRWALSIPSNTHLMGLGYGSKLVVDPALSIPVTTFHAIMVGTDTTPSSHVKISSLRLICNQTAIGGAWPTTTKYVQGIASRLDSGGGPLLFTEDVTVEGCWIEDANIAVSCTKDTSIDHSTSPRILAQHRTWNVRNNVIKGTTNKAIELAECRNSNIVSNTCLSVIDGPQSIQSSRNISIVSNIVEYRVTGINISHNSRGTKVVGNTVICVDSTNGESALLLRSEPYADASFMRDITITGNEFIDEVTSHNTVFAFQNRTENISSQMLAITITGNTFSGNVKFFDINSLNKLDARDITFTGNTMSTLSTVSFATCNVRQIKFSSNTITLACTFNANDWRIVGNTFKASLTLAAASSGNFLLGNDTPTFVDSGSNNAGIPNNDFNAAAQHIQSGSLTSNATNPTAVVFSVPFKTGTVPNVVPATTSTAAASDAYVANITATGFDLYTFVSGAAAARAVNWIAVGVR